MDLSSARISSFGQESINLNQKAQDPEVSQAAEDFEALFIHKLFQEMRKAGEQIKGAEEKETAHEMYLDMMDEAVSKLIAKRGGIGIASILMRQIKQND